MNTLENAEGLAVSNYSGVVVKTPEAPAPVVLGESCEQKKDFATVSHQPEVEHTLMRWTQKYFLNISVYIYIYVFFILTECLKCINYASQ